MTLLAQNTSVNLALTDGGQVTIATNGGFASVQVTPVVGAAYSRSIGPIVERVTFGPFPEGASVTISNQTAVLDYTVSGLTDGSALGGGGSALPRPVLLVMGNSLAEQTTGLLLGITGDNSTTIATVQPAGTKALQVTDATTFSAGQKVAIDLDNTQMFVTEVVSVDTAATPDVITLKDPIPSATRALRRVQPFAANSAPRNYTRHLGPVNTAVAKLGAEFEVVNGYGLGGAGIQEIVSDLPEWLRSVRPVVVVLHLLENSMGLTLFSTQRLVELVTLAARMCVASGATPIVASQVPNSGYNATAIARFDQLAAHCINIGTVVPGAIGVDLSSPWLDTAQPTLRTPLAGWTDGIHPVGNRRATVGDLFVPALQSLGYSPLEVSSIALYHQSMAGTGGTATGTGVQAGAQVSAGCAVTLTANATGTFTKTFDDKQRIQFAIPGASESWQEALIYLTEAIPLPMGLSGSLVSGCAVLDIQSKTQIFNIFVSLLFNNGVEYSIGRGSFSSGVVNDIAFTGRLPLETCGVSVPIGATTVQIKIGIVGNQLASPSGVTADFVIREAAVLPVSSLGPDCSFF